MFYIPRGEAGQSPPRSDQGMQPIPNLEEVNQTNEKCASEIRFSYNPRIAFASNGTEILRSNSRTRFGGETYLFAIVDLLHEEGVLPHTGNVESLRLRTDGIHQIVIIKGFCRDQTLNLRYICKYLSEYPRIRHCK